MGLGPEALPSSCSEQKAVVLDRSTTGDHRRRLLESTLPNKSGPGIALVMVHRNYVKLLALEVFFIVQVLLAGANSGYFQGPNNGVSTGSRNQFGTRTSNDDAIRYLIYYMSQMPSSRDHYHSGPLPDRGVKRYGIGSEFLGKRSVSEGVPFRSQEETSGESLDSESLEIPVDSDFVDKRMGSEFLGKRMGSEFLGKRMGSEFLGKRMGSEFLGKRMGSEFLGKRMGSEFLGKRMGSEFLGKRMGSEFLGKRTPIPGIFDNELDSSPFHSGRQAKEFGSSDVGARQESNRSSLDIPFLPQSATGSRLSPEEETNWEKETRRANV